MTERSAAPFGPSGLSLVQPTPPEITDRQAAELARELFGVEVEARSLGSNQDVNFLLQNEQGRSLLKIANPAAGRAELVAQSRAAEWLSEREPALRVPRTRLGRNGELVSSFDVEGRTLQARWLDFVEGSALFGNGYLAPVAVQALGTMAGRVALALADFTAEGDDRAHQWDLRLAPEVLTALLPYVPDPALRSALESAAAAAWARLEPLIPQLAVQVVHGDLTGDNVVVPAGPAGRAAVPDGVIDFGDLGRSWAVAEIAITLSSLLHRSGGSIHSAMRALLAYHAVRPLSRAEAEALWPLVVLRGAVLVASASQIRAVDPENSYATANFADEQAIFERAVEIPSVVATALVLETLGLPVERPRLPPFRPLLPSLAAGDVTVLDLSADSPALHEGRWLETSGDQAVARPQDGLIAVEREVAGEALRSGARAAVTRHGEARLTRSVPYSLSVPDNAALVVHLALAQEQTVVAPWAGVVTTGRAGLTLVGPGVRLDLRGLLDLHDLHDGRGLRDLEDRGDLGDEDRSVAVAAGDRLGHTGPSLEVQVSVDGPDPVPAFTTAALARAWSVLSLDPGPLLPAFAPEPIRESAADLLTRRQRSLADVQEFYYDEPPVMVRGWREHLVDSDGRVYLDMLNNVTSIGHAHPRLVEAVTEQWRRLNTNSRFHYPAVVDLAERLAGLLPAGLDSVFLVNSGTEAVDLALRISRAWSGRPDVLAVREAYHGWSDLADAVSTSIADNPGALETRPGWVHTVQAPNSYRGRHRGAEAGRYAEDAVATVLSLAEKGTPVGTFIAEAYYGNAGGMALPDGYLAAVLAAVRATGGLYVADEVQVGYGRLGEWFWGFEQQAVVPDIVTVAKAMGNGHPLGAVVTTTAIAERFRSQGYFFSSAGGSPVSSVVGTTVLDVIRDERLQENAREVGGYLKARLAELGQRHRLVGTVHGNGFYLGLEFVRDRETLEPATEETAAICERLRELGVIMQPTSDRQCVLKIKPPMCLTRSSADFFVEALDLVLRTGW